MSGPPRTPTQTRRAKGNPGKRAYNKREPKPPTGAPAMPDSLDDHGRAAWKRLVADAEKSQVLTKVDGGIFELAAQAYSTWRQAEAEWRKEGLTYETTNTEGGTVIKAHPAIAIASDAWRRYRAAVCELGFTPAARAKVSTVDANEDEAPGSDFFQPRH